MYASAQGPAMITATIPVQMATIETGTRTRNENITTAARIVIAVALTAVLLWQSDPGAVWDAARRADWRFIVLACMLVALDRVLMATDGSRFSHLYTPTPVRRSAPSCASSSSARL
jgi:di/tricarboxylate transporter